MQREIRKNVMFKKSQNEGDNFDCWQTMSFYSHAMTKNLKKESPGLTPTSFSYVKASNTWLAIVFARIELTKRNKMNCMQMSFFLLLYSLFQKTSVSEKGTRHKLPLTQNCFIRNSLHVWFEVILQVTLYLKLYFLQYYATSTLSWNLSWNLSWT